MRTSLGLRLLLAAVFTTALALIATGLVLNFLFRLYFEDRARAELETYLLLLSGNVSVSTLADLEITPLADPRFKQPLSGYYWQVQLDDQPPVLSASFWAAPLTLQRPELAGHITFQDVETGTGERVAVASWIVTTGDGDTRREVFLAVAIDRADLDDSAARFSMNSALWLGVLGVFLLAASWFQVRVGLRPLDKVRSEVSRVVHASTDRLSDDYPSEVLPLIDEVNSLLDTNADTLDRVRAGAGNLAHGLKTPLTILRGVQRKLAKSGQADLAEELGTEVTNIEHIVERELARSRDSHQILRQCDVAPIAMRLHKALSRQPGAEHLTWSVDVDQDMRAPFDAFDLTELLGNLLDNAMKWAHSEIAVHAGTQGDNVFICIDDDGPGVPRSAREAVLARGSRLDAHQDGSGLGLSIVKDMAQAHGCALTLERAEIGGLRVRLTWTAAP